MTEKFILKGREVVHEPDLMVWAEWMQNGDRRVAETKVGKASVSTVFLGLNHQFSAGGPPILFETMVFGGGHDQYQNRCSTWKEAEEMHDRAVEMVGGKG